MSQEEVEDAGGNGENHENGGNQSGDTKQVEASPPVYIVIPALNEASALPITLRHLSKLSPRPAGIIVSDGGSTDGTPRLAESLGAVVVGSDRGRSVQMNTGAWKAVQLMQQVQEQGSGNSMGGSSASGSSTSSGILCFVHADTLVPLDLVTLVRSTLQDQSVCCGGFVPVVAVPGRVFWGMCLRNVAKTCDTGSAWFSGVRAFLRGMRMLYGDQAMFCRAQDFVRIGGFDERLAILEDADLSERIHVDGWQRTMPVSRYSLGGVGDSDGEEKLRIKRGGEMVMLPRVVVTSGRSLLVAFFESAHKSFPLRIAALATSTVVAEASSEDSSSAASMVPQGSAKMSSFEVEDSPYNNDKRRRSNSLFVRAGVYLQQSPALQFAAFLCTLVFLWGITFALSPNRLP
ncbi:unnamed protein product [Closterium sp. Yama58-4]|nr:unnamed protein product [Closterium sp. Yama58-4]